MKSMSKHAIATMGYKHLIEIVQIYKIPVAGDPTTITAPQLRKLLVAYFHTTPVETKTTHEKIGDIYPLTSELEAIKALESLTRNSTIRAYFTGLIDAGKTWRDAGIMTGVKFSLSPKRVENIYRELL